MANTLQIKRTTDSTCNDAVVEAGELVWSDNASSGGGANGKLYVGDTGGAIRHIGGVGTGAVAGVINNATADELVTVASTTSELDAEATLTYNTTAGLGLSTVAADVPFTMTNTETTYTSCAHIKMVKNGADVVNNESLGKITAYGDDSGGAVTQYGELNFRINDRTHTDESGKFEVTLATADGTNTTMQRAFMGVGHATTDMVDTYIGYSGASTCSIAGKTTIAGDLTLSPTASLLTFGNGEVIKNTTNGTIDVTATTFRTSGNVLIPDAGTIGSASNTSALAISSAGVVALAATTEASAVGTAALTVAGGLGVAKDLWLGDDLTLDSDSAIISLGADQDVTLTHVADTGLLLNSSMQLQFRDSTEYINSDANGSMNIRAATDVALNVNGTDELLINASTATFGTNLMLPDGATIGVASDSDAITIASTGDVTLSQDLNVSGSLNVTGAVVEVDSTSMVVKDKEMWLGVPGGVIEKVASRSNGSTTATITSASHGLNEGETVLIVGAAFTNDGIYTILTGGAFASGVFEIASSATTAIVAQPIWHSVANTTNALANGSGIFVAGATEGGTPLGAQGWAYDYSPNPAWETKIGIRCDSRDSGAIGFKITNPLAGTDVGSAIVDFHGTHTGVGDAIPHYTTLLRSTATTTSSNTAAENNATTLAVSPEGMTIPASKTATVISSATFFEPIITLGSSAVVTNAATVHIASVPTEGTNNYALYGTGHIGGFTIDGGTF
jgi:hypothetical protein